MKVYKLDHDFENFFTFSIENGELFSKMPTFSAKFKARSRISDWVTPNSEFFQSENYKSSGIHIPDITTWLLGNIVLNKKAYNLLHEQMSSFGEFLEARCEGNEYYIFNTLKVLPDEYIDQDNTTQNIVSGIPMGLESLSFKDLDNNEFMLFKTSADKLTYTYCTENFVKLINESGLMGIIFDEKLV